MGVYLFTDNLKIKNMSLWFSLYTNKTLKCECGKVHEIETEKEVFSINITHNLTKMAEAVGLYNVVWRPDEMAIYKAKQLIDPLTSGLKKLKDKPEYYSQFNASNGWGMYEHFVPFVESCLNACIENPEATIHVSR